MSHKSAVVVRKLCDAYYASVGAVLVEMREKIGRSGNFNLR